VFCFDWVAQVDWWQCSRFQELPVYLRFVGVLIHLLLRLHFAEPLVSPLFFPFVSQRPGALTVFPLVFTVFGYKKGR
jgi:hypothetical protein